jgi:hypothetical protein
MFRIRMNLTNPNVYASISTVSAATAIPSYSNTALNAAMIERIYKTKPGCSSCGKKVY